AQMAQRILEVVGVEVAEERDLGTAMNPRVRIEEPPEQARPRAVAAADDDRPIAARHQLAAGAWAAAKSGWLVSGCEASSSSSETYGRSSDSGRSAIRSASSAAR